MVAKSTGSSTSSSFVAAVPGGLPALVLFALSLASYVAQVRPGEVSGKESGPRQMHKLGADTAIVR